jgi:hypothetical protein
MKKTRIEGYLVLPWHGQHRFSFDILENGQFTNLNKSDREYDFYWEAGMRSRPTLQELVDLDNHQNKHLQYWQDTIRYAFISFGRMNPNCVFKPNIGDIGTLSFVTIKDYYEN